MKQRSKNSFRQSWRKGLLLLLCPLLASTVARATDLTEDGIAYLTTVRGEVTLHPKDQPSVEPTLHSLHTISETRIKTGPESALTLVLSNGAAVCIDEETELAVSTFRQKPFERDRASLSAEPSVSEVRLQLIRGRVALAGNRLSPLSQLEVMIDSGRLRVHSAIAVLEKTNLGTKIATLDGSLTFYYANNKGREFINGSLALRITPQSAELGRVAERIPAEAIPAKWRAIGASVEWANKRVYFLTEADKWPPRAIPLVSKEYFDKEPIRPYSFLQPAYNR